MGLLVRHVFEIYLFTVTLFGWFGVITQGEHACESRVFCHGPLLETIQKADLYNDSKVFVDQPLKVDPKVVEGAFNASMTRAQLEEFVTQYFLESGRGLERWEPPDWVESPKFVSGIKDPRLRSWALKLNEFWKQLGRTTQSTVAEYPERHTLIAVPHPFIIAGGRFDEYYYWDSFWIVKGLLLCEMRDTARGMILNLASLVDRFGLVPNGGRTYYSRRSQPPLLTQMASLYYEATQNDTFLMEILPSLDREYEFWSQNRSVTGGQYADLNTYSASLTDPRPEAYREDIATSKFVDDKARLYTNLASAAESGMDFSSRWLSDSGNLSTIRTTDVLPVDLNAILCGNEALLAKLHNIAGNPSKSNMYEDAFRKRQARFNSVFWSDSLGFWSDVLMSTGDHQKNFYLAFLAPLAWKCVEENTTQQLILHNTLKTLKFFDYVGGIPTSSITSGQQWDFPNSWAPFQWYLINAWYNSSSEELRTRALSVATKWINTTYVVWREKGVMYEKYNVVSGDPGSGGEYIVQTGFGWTNAVVLHFLHLYGEVLHTTSGSPQVTTPLWITAVVLGVLLILCAVVSILCGIWCRWIYVKGKRSYWSRVQNEHLMAASSGGRDRDDSQGSEVLLVNNSALDDSTEGVMNYSDDYRTFGSNNYD